MSWIFEGSAADISLVLSEMGHWSVHGTATQDCRPVSHNWDIVRHVQGLKVSLHSLRSHLSSTADRPKRHRSPAASPAHYLPTRFRALALFSRRSPERLVRSSLPASENLHSSGLMQCSKEHPYWMALEASTVLGTRMVKVEPWPGVLSTVMSPPIIRQKRRLIARPRPVPPYLLAVAVEA